MGVLVFCGPDGMIFWSRLVEANNTNTCGWSWDWQNPKHSVWLVDQQTFALLVKMHMSLGKKNNMPPKSV
jgi:hypothetical protein